MTQFLVETVVLSSLGGIVGIAIGWVVSILGAKAAGRTVRSPARGAWIETSFAMAWSRLSAPRGGRGLKPSGRRQTCYLLSKSVSEIVWIAAAPRRS